MTKLMYAQSLEKVALVVVNFDFLLGMALGLIIMDSDDAAEYECEWGFSLFLGPMVFTVVKPA
jgi:hypothetical protein